MRQTVNQGIAIELQIEKIGQLFNTLDPMPFRGRDLDREAEEYIVSWARELPRKTPIRILIHLPQSEAASENARELGHALARYFRYGQTLRPAISGSCFVSVAIHC
jgi:hypothetical protein